MKICLIPARAGSKRIKNKNIKKFLGKPLIAWSIQKAKESKLFDDIIVSTDSKKIANIAKKFGASIPFLRPKRLADDYTIDIEVLQHYLDYVSKNKIKIKTLCYLYATNPLVKVSTLKKCYNLIKKSKYPKVMTVCKYPSPIERAFKKNYSGEVKLREKKYVFHRSQNLNEYYYDAGHCYWYNIDKYEKIRNKKNIKTLSVELDKYEVQDINTMKDFLDAEKLFKLNK